MQVFVGNNQDIPIPGVFCLGDDFKFFVKSVFRFPFFRVYDVIIVVDKGYFKFLVFKASACKYATQGFAYDGVGW